MDKKIDKLLKQRRRAMGIYRLIVCNCGGFIRKKYGISGNGYNSCFICDDCNKWYKEEELKKFKIMEVDYKTYYQEEEEEE